MHLDTYTYAETVGKDIFIYIDIHVHAHRMNILSHRSHSVVATHKLLHKQYMHQRVASCDGWVEGNGLYHMNAALAST